MPDNPHKPHIIVDEDWKAQVEAEKRAAAEKRTGAPASQTAGAPTAAQSSGDRSSAAPAPDDLPLPPPSLPFLLTTLATQAMIALGQVPNPITGKSDLRLPQAKHYIDTLAMLELKTAGNRTPDESALLDDLLHQLRMAYVMLQSSGSGADSSRGNEQA